MDGALPCSAECVAAQGVADEFSVMDTLPPDEVRINTPRTSLPYRRTLSADALTRPSRDVTPESPMRPRRPLQGQEELRADLPVVEAVRATVGATRVVEERPIATRVTPTPVSAAKSDDISVISPADTTTSSNAVVDHADIAMVDNADAPARAQDLIGSSDTAELRPYAEQPERSLWKRYRRVLACIGFILPVIALAFLLYFLLKDGFMRDDEAEAAQVIPDAPSEAEMESASPPVMEHEGGLINEAGLGLYVVGIDASAAFNSRVDLEIFLTLGGVTITPMSCVDAFEAALSAELVRDLSSGRWGAVQSLERSVQLSAAPRAGAGPMRFGSRVRRLTSQRLRRLSPRRLNALTAGTEITAAQAPDGTRPWHLEYLYGQAGGAGGPYTGEGVDIAVLSTGIRANHQELANHITAGSDSDDLVDSTGLGTAMAGLALGDTVGVANGSHATALRVTSPSSGVGSSSDALLAIDRVGNSLEPGGRRVAMMTLAGGFHAALSNGVQNLIHQGVTVVVPAGDESGDACDFSPASAPGAVTVASMGASGEVSSFSNTGECVDFLAPGEELLTASHTSDDGYVTATGTSPAAAVAAGVAALHLEASSPGTSPSALAEALRQPQHDGLPRLPLMSEAGTSGSSTTAPLPQAISGSVARVGPRRLAGTPLQLQQGDVLDARLSCTCESAECDVDLYIYAWEDRRWQAVAVSRSFAPQEYIRGQNDFGGPRFFAAAAWTQLGFASCELGSRVVRRA